MGAYRSTMRVESMRKRQYWEEGMELDLCPSMNNAGETYKRPFDFDIYRMARHRGGTSPEIC
jgi:hypothetical protein